ncbi:ABC transporter substrate-binding protein [Blastococcus sp. PRF04-17]|uniref:ABC transporter substrate-binding protein n=1 Tax=Blastococcus sp. PRF04-17 TaxID=2933797 RepID=UPI001FF5BD5D|nr:ABC transporter substrate-binding protein [Blastococcus sp. PRF04-17]UOY03180.1 ABC transporter substrate-binding protein [Blastococcus sp. PRF04-17]
MKHRTRSLLVASSCLAALTACSTTAPGSEGNGAAGGDVATGNGVSDSTITIGFLTDLTGPFAAASEVMVAETQAYWDARNEDGGICERSVEVDVQDHAYDPQKAVALYRSMQPNVLAFQQLQGSPIVPAVMPLAEEDRVYVGGMGWASSTLPYETAQIPGATYSVEGANAIDYLVDELGLTEGDTVGVVYFVGDLGGDSLAGAQHAADERGLEIVSQEITPRDTDLSAQAAAFQQAGVSAVIVAAAPPQLASIAGVLASLDVNVPILSNTPAFNPALLNTPAGPALIENGYTVQSIAPYAAEEPGVQDATALYEEVAPDGAKGWEVPLAYAQAELLADAIERACDAGDLTPEGVVTAMRETADLDLEGLYPAPVDYTEVGEPPLRTVYVTKVDEAVPGGLRMLTTFEGPSAESYSFE